MVNPTQGDLVKRQPQRVIEAAGAHGAICRLYVRLRHEYIFHKHRGAPVDVFVCSGGSIRFSRGNHHITRPFQQLVEIGCYFGH